MAKTLILGIGNKLRNDDGVGIVTIELIRNLLQTLDTDTQQLVDIQHAHGEGTELMFIWQEYDSVVVVDAVRALNRPGYIHRLDANENQIPSDLFHYSTHAFSLAEAIELARSLHQLPASLVVYGIEGEDFGYGERLTLEVSVASWQVCQEILTLFSSGITHSE